MCSVFLPFFSSFFFLSFFKLTGVGGGIQREEELGEIDTERQTDRQRQRGELGEIDTERERERERSSER